MSESQRYFRTLLITVTLAVLALVALLKMGKDGIPVALACIAAIGLNHRNPGSPDAAAGLLLLAFLGVPACDVHSQFEMHTGRCPEAPQVAQVQATPLLSGRAASRFRAQGFAVDSLVVSTTGSNPVPAGQVGLWALSSSGMLQQTDAAGNVLQFGTARAITLASAAPGGPAEGWIYGNTTAHTLQYYDGSSWTVMPDDSLVVHKAGTETITGQKTFTLQVLAPGLDTASAGTLLLGQTNATSISLLKNVTMAAGTTLIINGNTLISSDKLQATQLAGVVPVANGGTNSSTALNSNRIMCSVGGAIVECSALTNGQLLIGSTGAAPVAASVTGANGIGITAGAGTLQITQTFGTDGTHAAVGNDARFPPAPGTPGRVLYDNGTAWTALAACSDGESLVWASGVPTCATPSASNPTGSGAALTDVYAGMVYAGATGALSNNSTRYLSAPNAGEATTPVVIGVAPIATTQLGTLTCMVGTACGGGGTIAFTVAKSTDASSYSDTMVTCTITDPATTCASVTTDTATAGQVLAVKFVTTSCALASPAHCSFRLSK